MVEAWSQDGVGMSGVRGSGSGGAAEGPGEAASVSRCWVPVRPSRRHLPLPRGLVLTVPISTRKGHPLLV